MNRAMILFQPRAVCMCAYVYIIYIIHIQICIIFFRRFEKDKLKIYSWCLLS